MTDAGIGARIRRRRIELDMTQDELAKKVGYKTRASINQIELNARNLTQSKIMSFAKALNTTPSYIMGWDEENEAIPQQGIGFELPTDLQLQMTRYRAYMDGFMRLDEDDREEVLQIINMKLSKSKYKNEVE